MLAVEFDAIVEFITYRDRKEASPVGHFGCEAMNSFHDRIDVEVPRFDPPGLFKLVHRKVELVGRDMMLGHTDKLAYLRCWKTVLHGYTPARNECSRCLTA